MKMNRRTALTGAFAAATLPAAPLSAFEMPDSWRPQIVDMPQRYKPGIVMVYPDRFSLFWTLADGKAIRYAVRVGRGDLYEPGDYYVGARKEWPSWTPTPDMIAREPERWGQFKDGMPGGPNNPLGARALYLFLPGRGDTFLRIHGTNDPGSIGRAVSNGCVGLLNDHMAHLYDLVPMQTRVLLYPKGTA